MKSVFLVISSICAVAAFGAQERRISLESYRDKAAGAWLGQSIGVAYGWPTEFKYIGNTVGKRLRKNGSPRA